MASKAPLQPLPFILPNSPTEIDSTPRSADTASTQAGFPVGQTTFVGRCAEIEALRDFLVDPQQRLVTVLGPGGVGKTRLALATAERVAHAFPDGAAFVDLSGLSHADQVANAIATTLNVRGQPHCSLLQSVIAAVGKERVLLVLDNLEHLMGPELQTLVSRLVLECPGVTILTTSREPLRLAQEQRMIVGPLAVPASGETPQAVHGLDGVLLFVARAKSVAPEFAPNASELQTVGEICRRVDGLPLAIELAAAWMRVLSPAALLTQLDERLPVLTGGMVDQPARFRTMRDAIAWSYDRLLPEEASLLRRLSVFRGGFTLEAALRVDAVPEACRAFSTLQLIASLCDKHLVYRADAVEEVQRFGMLETIREFALERLEAEGGLASARAAHANVYQDLAERAEPEMLGPREIFWFAILDAEASNLREAITWGLQNSVETALRILSANWGYWSWRAITEGRRLFGEALALPSRGTPNIRARALRSANALASLGGDYEASAALSAESTSIARLVNDPWLRGELLWNCALFSVYAGDLPRAAQELDDALPLMDRPRTVSERALAAYAQSHRGIIAYLMGDNELGSQCFSQSIVTLREVGASTVLIIVLGDAAGWLLRDNQIDLARPLLHEALNLYDRSPVGWVQVAPLSGLALIDALEGRSIRASRRLGAIAALVARAGLGSSPNFQGTLDRAESQAANNLGRAAFLAEWEIGRRNPARVVEDALATAISESADPCAMQLRLTAREREVLHLVVDGRSDRDIAAELFISERTASKHVSTILQKLDAGSRGDAAVRALRLGLV